jgi:hypothetical protein
MLVFPPKVPNRALNAGIRGEKMRPNQYSSEKRRKELEKKKKKEEKKLRHAELKSKEKDGSEGVEGAEDSEDAEGAEGEASTDSDGESL